MARTTAAKTTTKSRAAPRFKTGMTATDDYAARLAPFDQPALALWAADCAERVLSHFENLHPTDDRPRRAIEATRVWARGELKMMQARQAAVRTHAAARASTDPAAVAAARAAGYTNAGTCEFLLDASGAFYFLEMNTRIQVEHPVTELVTGVDLVQWQLRVAAGERLSFTQESVSQRGWAIECRITSEDPANGFLPSTGRVQYLHVPAGPGVRWDGGIETGSEITLHYDPMLAKLIVWAPDRAQAISRMHRALLELTIEGVETSRDFHLRVMEDSEFRAGAIEIQWLERRLTDLAAPTPPRASIVRAAIAAALLAERDRGTRRAPAGVATATSPVDVATSSGWLELARREALR